MISNQSRHPVITERKPIRWILTFIALLYVTFFLILPFVTVFTEGLHKGWSAYIGGIRNSDTYEAIKLTLLVAAITVPCNLVFGIFASWLIAKFNFFGKRFLVSLIDLPFSIPPVIVGLMLILFLGTNGLLGPFLTKHDIKIIFSIPGIVLATIFVTFPFIARELIPLMESQGNDEEEAALTLGANGLQTFFHITLPNIKWALLYGMILCNARAMGEFGAVSVVSGHIRGLTNTLPLQVELLYNENYVAAFAVASLLTFLGILTLILKSLIEWKTGKHQGSKEHKLS